MSPDMNPPNATKRTKKKPTTLKQNFDYNCLLTSDYFPLPPYHNYYPRGHSPAEPMSLPAYPYTLMSPEPSTVLDLTYSMASEGPEYARLQTGGYQSEQEEGEDPKRRFSDPGLPNESESSLYKFADVDASIEKLQQQVALLRDSHARMTRDMMEMKLELNLLRQQQSNRQYEPGLLADVIREVREAARVREDALLARVKHVMEEKQLSVSQLSLAMEKDKNTDRIAKLEEQLRSLTVNGSSRSDSCTVTSLNASTTEDKQHQSARQVLDLERETLELRRELQDTRNKKDEADQKVLRLSNMLRRSEPSDDSLSTLTTSSVCQSPKVVLSGPVTSL